MTRPTSPESSSVACTLPGLEVLGAMVGVRREGRVPRHGARREPHIRLRSRGRCNLTPNTTLFRPLPTVVHCRDSLFRRLWDSVIRKTTDNKGRGIEDQGRPAGRDRLPRPGSVRCNCGKGRCQVSRGRWAMEPGEMSADLDRHCLSPRKRKKPSSFRASQLQVTGLDSPRRRRACKGS